MIWAILSTVCFGIIVCVLLSNRAAYRNGVADGYGFSREPDNPGYQEARTILIEGSSHRWPDIESYCEPTVQAAAAAPQVPDTVPAVR